MKCWMLKSSLFIRALLCSAREAERVGSLVMSGGREGGREVEIKGGRREEKIKEGREVREEKKY